MDCGPGGSQSPRQRGSNENTNGLLREYFPKGTDLNAHSPDAIAAVAATLNARRRKRWAGRHRLRRLTSASHRSTNTTLRRPVVSAQPTSIDFTGVLKREEIAISMDGRGCWRDNVFVERLWRSVKYEEVYLQDYVSVPETRAGTGCCFAFYNGVRPRSSHGCRTPDQIYINQPLLAAA